MSMNRVSMALDDVIKADRKAGKGNKNGKKGGPGVNNKNGNAKNGAGKRQQPATAQLVKKLVKRALAQRGVGVKPRAIRHRNNTNAGGNRTVVKKVVRRVSAPPRNNRNKPLGVSQRSRTIVRRRVVPAPQPTRTIVREVRYIREPPRPAPRVQHRVVYQQPRQSRPPPRQVVYVDSPRRLPRYSGGSSFSSRRPAIRRNNDPFYEPRNFLQRVPSGRY
uniref:Uncharacterized protein n=1 Tax=Panagrolaimus superbus TaxID=310955 RepID=A0A914YW00_9BILA